MTVIRIVVGTLETIPKGLLKRLEDLEIRGQVETIQDRFIKMGKNTEKSPGDLGRLTLT